MYTLTLSEEEKDILVNLIEYTISETRSEIVHSETHQVKELLRTRKQLLMGMLDRLKTESIN